MSIFYPFSFVLEDYRLLVHEHSIMSATLYRQQARNLTPANFTADSAPASLTFVALLAVAVRAVALLPAFGGGAHAGL